MKIKFVNHSCFIVEHEGVSIISDPWLEGRIFNNGWDLLSKTKLTYDDFRNIQFIWFSHEHPDHFYPPNLKLIPAEYKKNITVIFQHTIDGRVANYCRKAGFKDVVEIRPNQTYQLGQDFSIMCEYFSEGDSWIVYKSGELTILNTNDCGIRNVSEIDHIKHVVGNVDILLTQFSYAYWAGNREDVAYRRKVAEDKLKFMQFQCDGFKPKVTIPIASYVYFCHEENFYLNDSVNTAAKAFEFLSAKTATIPVILYPGDEYEFLQEWNSERSISSYNADFESIAQHPEVLEKTKSFDLTGLRSAADTFVKNLRENHGLLPRLILRPTFIHLSDLNRSFRLSLSSGLEDSTYGVADCDVSLASESLAFCFSHPYGLDTTQINGRLQKPKGGHYSRFFNFFRIDQQKSRGQDFTFSYLIGVAIRRLKVKLGIVRV